MQNAYIFVTYFVTALNAQDLYYICTNGQCMLIVTAYYMLFVLIQFYVVWWTGTVGQSQTRKRSSSSERYVPVGWN
jgi:hypothetical protein